jgi:PhnB protein
MPDLTLIEQLDKVIDALLAGAEAPKPADLQFAALLEIAGALCDLPDDRFRKRLSAELGAASPVIHTVTPFISAPEGAKLIDFMQHAFGAVETARHPHQPDGFVAGVRIGDSDLLVMGGESVRGQERPAALHVYVKECDAAYQRALDAGAVTVGPPGFGAPAERPYGERAAFVTDPFGNLWNIATRLGVSYIPEGQRHVTPALLPSNAPALIDFLKRAFGAEEVGHRHEEAGRMVHAFLRIGEALVEMSEVAEEAVRPFGFYLRTNDVDAVYHRAVDAGAISLSPPADQAFGDRMAVLQDPFGNYWFPATPIKNAPR